MPKTPFEHYVAEQLAWYADGEGGMAHDVLYRIQKKYLSTYGDLPEVVDE